MSISVFTLNLGNFLSRHKAKLIATPTLKSSQFRSPLHTDKSILHSPRHENQVHFDSDFKQNPFRPPHKTKSIMIPTLKSSQLRSPTLNHVYFDHPHNNQVNFDANTKTMSFSARVTLRVIHTSTCSCDTAAIRRI